jgi:copper chaperone
MRTRLIKVTGMTCGGCSSKVTRTLKALAGVDEVRVSLEVGEATVRYDETRVSSDQLELALTSAGFGVGAASEPVIRRCCG